MSKKKVKTKEDFINEPKVVALPGQTYSYGQTPAALCRQHFKEIAEHLNMSVEELATSVLNKSVGDQLTMLKDFYKSKFQETDAVYEPLLELYSSKEKKNEDPSEKSLPKKRKTSEAPAVTVRVKKSFPLILSSDSETEDQKNKGNEKPSNKTRQQAIKSSNKRSTAVNATLTRIQNSIEDTIAFTSTSVTQENTVNPRNQEQVIVDFNSDKLEEIINFMVPKTSNDSQSNQLNITKESTKEPKTVIDLVAGPSNTTKPEEEDLETLLFGKSPAKSKPPPKKKFQQRSLEALSQPTMERTRTSTFDEFDSSPSSQFSTPGLTFESTSCSPSSRQRDLLLVARDIAALQKVVASGKKLGDSVSVSDTIKFTN